MLASFSVAGQAQAPDAVMPLDLTRPATSSPAPPAAFRTRHASFEPTSFNELPGWQDDRLADAWVAFRQSCVALAKKPAWIRPCLHAKEMDGRSEEALRDFFEREFYLYKIHDAHHSPQGVITGYYEPQLNGDRQYGAPYVYPIYAVPDDMKFLDARLLTRPADDVRVHVEGRRVLPVASTNATASPVYRLDVANLVPDIRTRLYRLRIAGDQVVGYYSRQEIERAPLKQARVIAWVDNRAALYSMHIQGSGKIRMPNGQIIRVGYAEQNGHPFLPTLSGPAGNMRPAAGATRSLKEESAESDDPPPASKEELLAAITAEQAGPGEQEEQEDMPRTRSLRGPRTVISQSDVESVIAALLPPSERPHPREPTWSAQSKLPSAGSAPAAQDVKRSEPVRRTRLTEGAFSGGMTGQPDTAVANRDPSYVFFRAIPDNEYGPIGALGVPLTAGRSVAVDPRTTPLGAPVFISTKDPERKEVLNRLMIAQDTGGAIRGAVRADYFWGFGEKAFHQAIRMKEGGQMWLLLPQSQKLAAGDGSTRMRSLRGPGADSALPDCVIADPELCVE
ncbi:MAG: hypothetical protein NVSMB6_11300 [Burkholderiaceae bacterium]